LKMSLLELLLAWVMPDLVLILGDFHSNVNKI